MNNANRSKFIPEPVSIWLGQGESIKEYKVIPAAWGSLYRLKGILRELLGNMTDLWNSDLVNAVRDVATSDNTEAAARLQQLAVNEALWKVLDSLLNKPQEVFELAIPDLDPKLFVQDNPEGITIPQVFETFGVIVKVNQLETAKKLLGGLANPKTMS